MSALLSLTNLQAWYGDIQALRGVDVEVRESEVVTILGANGAGKTTLLRAISGVVATEGTIKFGGERINAEAPHRRVERGLVHIPEGRGVFPFLSVAENLELGAFPSRARAGRRLEMERVLDLFPPLKALLHRHAGSLSGGEQQMVAIGRGLMSKPRLLMLDEPSLGLAPMVFDAILETIQHLNESGLAILLVEQAVQDALSVAHRCYVFGEGRVLLSGDPERISRDPRVREAYFGQPLPAMENIS